MMHGNYLVQVGSYLLLRLLSYWGPYGITEGSVTTVFLEFIPSRVII